MQIDAVAHRAGERVVQRECDRISLADADHRAGHGSIIGPIMVTDPVGEEPGDRAGFQLDMNLCRFLAVDRRGNRGSGQPLEVAGRAGIWASSATGTVGAGAGVPVLLISCAWAQTAHKAMGNAAARKRYQPYTKSFP